MKRILIKAGHFTRDNGHSNSPNDLDLNRAIKDVLVEVGILKQIKKDGCCTYELDLETLNILVNTPPA